MAEWPEREIYLDNNATTQCLPEVRAAMLEALGAGFGNPSSAHARGDYSRRSLDKARESVATLIGAPPSGVCFTSSGTEANNMVMRSAVRSGKNSSRVIATAAEHSSVLKMCEELERLGVEVVLLAVDHLGHIDLGELDKTLTVHTDLVSVQWVNNETGVIQPVKEIGQLCRSRRVKFHTDAAQAVGKLNVNVSELPIDYLSLTAHKLNGPQGIGVVYAHPESTLTPMFYGGPQEMGLRPGTENVAGIVGLGKAAELRRLAFETVGRSLAMLRDYFERRIIESVPGVQVNGGSSDRVCNTTNLRFAGVDGEALVARLDREGIRCSQSAACTSQRPEPSHVLLAMGLSEEEAYSSVRFSFGLANTHDDAEQAAETVIMLCQELREFRTRLLAKFADGAEVT